MATQFRAKSYADEGSKLEISKMSNYNVKNWAERLTEEVYDTWKNEYPDYLPGVKVFYSPVILNPDLMIISYQPGGNETHFENEDKIRFKEGDFSIKNNEFMVADYRIARMARDFFNFNGGEDILKKNVIFPLIFFRAASVRVWRGIRPVEKRRQMEQFCFLKVKDIIEKVVPKRILVIGLATTYDALNNLLDISDENILYRRNGQSIGARMAVSSRSGVQNIFAIAHLSARISKSDRIELSKLFFRWF